MVERGLDFADAEKNAIRVAIASPASIDRRDDGEPEAHGRPPRRPIRRHHLGAA